MGELPQLVDQSEEWPEVGDVVRPGEAVDDTLTISGTAS